MPQWWSYTIWNIIVEIIWTFFRLAHFVNLISPEYHSRIRKDTNKQIMILKQYSSWQINFRKNTGIIRKYYCDLKVLFLCYDESVLLRNLLYQLHRLPLVCDTRAPLREVYPFSQPKVSDANTLHAAQPSPLYTIPSLYDFQVEKYPNVNRNITEILLWFKKMSYRPLVLDLWNSCMYLFLLYLRDYSRA